MKDILPPDRDLAQDVAAVGRIDAVPTMLEVICRTTGLGFAAVARVTDDRWIACSVRDEIGFGLAPGGELDVGTTICSEVRRAHAAITIDHAEQDPVFREHPTPRRYGFQSYISVPIVRPDGRFFGTLCALDPRPARVDTPATTGLFKMFADLIGFHLDAQERIVAGEAVQRNEAFVKGILAASPDSVTVLSAEGRIEFMNEGGVTLNELGSVDEILGTDYVAMWPDEVKPLLREALAGAAGGRTTRVEAFCPTFKGTSRWWEARFAAFSAVGRNEPARIVGVCRDISDRRQVEMALRETERELRLALHAGRFGAWTLDAAERDLTTSETCRLNYGRDPDAPFTYDEWLAVLHPEDRESTLAAVAASTAAGHDLDVAFRIRTPAGGERWISVRGQAIAGADGESPARLHGVSQDITAQKHMERELRALNLSLERRVAASTAERNLLATLVETTDIFIMVVGLDWRIMAINKANADEFERIHGVRPEAGDHLLDLLADQPAHQAQVRAGWGRALAGEDYTIIEAFGDPDRDRPHYEIKFTALRDERGERIGAFNFVLDVSARLRDQARLAEAQEQLRQAQKMEAVGQLTGGIAHDFNNLLTVLRSSVDLLKRPNLPEERRQRYIEAISTTTTRAAKLTGQLLAFARRQALRPEVFDAVGGVRAIGDMVSTLTGARIRIDIDVPDAACFVNADASQFDTALVNMAVNARDAMNGEGRLTIAVRGVTGIPALRDQPAQDGAFVAVSLADTGDGIAAADLDRIFEPFFTTKGVGQGTGLGLSQVFGFVKQSGGEVAVTSAPGEGTTFTLYLPRVVGEGHRPVVPDNDQPPVDGHGTCVLVVEDNADVGSFATQTLAELGYHSVLAVDADGALAELGRDASRFDIVFSDVVMPGMNGIALGQEIRRRHRDLPVVLTSGYSHVLAENGTFGFELLQKPYSVEQLSRVLQKAAHWRRLQRVLDT